MDLHRKTAWTIFEKGLAYRDFTPPYRRCGKSGAQEPGCSIWRRELPAPKVPPCRCRRAIRIAFSRAPRRRAVVRFADAVYGEQVRLRRTSKTSHCSVPMACRPTIWLPVRRFRPAHLPHPRQDHLSILTHILIFEAAGCKPPSSRTCVAGRADGTSFPRPPRSCVSVTLPRRWILSEASSIFFACSAGRPRTTAE